MTILSVMTPLYIEHCWHIVYRQFYREPTKKNLLNWLKNKCSIFNKTDNTHLVNVGGDEHLGFPTGTINIYIIEEH